MIIIVFGLPGSGKSFFASRLAEKLGARYINSDRLRLSMFTKRRYTKKEKEKVYEAMAMEVETSIGKDKTIVLDATFYKESIRKEFIQLAQKSGEKLLFIEIIAAESVISERLSTKRTYSEADYAVYLKIKSSFEPLKQYHLVLESTRENINSMLEEAIDHIQKNHGKSSGH